jgi:CARDB
MANCQQLKTQLDSLMEERDSVEAELENVSNPRERSNLIFELRNLNHEIATKRTQYNNCLHPPPPKPDLVAKTFQIKPNHTTRTMEVACVIQNDGDGPARGPFVVTLGVTFKDEKGATVTRQLDIQIPAGTTIEGHGTQFITRPMVNIPLLYRNEHPDAIYLLEMIVDANNQVAEVSESNNRLSQQYWALRPATP